MYGLSSRASLAPRRAQWGPDLNTEAKPAHKKIIRTPEPELLELNDLHPQPSSSKSKSIPEPSSSPTQEIWEPKSKILVGSPDDPLPKSKIPARGRDDPLPKINLQEIMECLGQLQYHTINQNQKLAQMEREYQQTRLSLHRIQETLGAGLTQEAVITRLEQLYVESPPQAVLSRLSEIQAGLDTIQALISSIPMSSIPMPSGPMSSIPMPSVRVPDPPSSCPVIDLDSNGVNIFTPFFIQEELVGRDNCTRLNHCHLEMVIEILGGYDSQPLIYPFGLTSNLPAFVEVVVDIGFIDANEMTGTIYGQFKRGETGVYTIEITEIYLNGERSAITDCVLPLKLKCDVDLLLQ